MSGIITPKTTKVIPNEGMPIYDKEVERDPDKERHTDPAVQSKEG